MKLLPMDELNNLETMLKTELKETVTESSQSRQTDIGSERRKRVAGAVGDIVEDILIMSYVYGTDDGNEMMKSSVEPDDSKMHDSVYHRIDGMDFTDRIQKDIEETIGAAAEAGIYSGASDEGTLASDSVINASIDKAIYDIMRIAETESHRIYNEAVSEVGKKTGAKSKTWQTMMDEMVRDTHDYLEGVTVPFNDDFYTFDGDHAFAPGGFEFPENNCNCRCTLRIR